METIPFVKYHGAGNDFILIEDREGHWSDRITESWVAKVCHRRFGIGADGLIILQKGYEGADFFMKYYNSDGRTSTFCGNGGRTIVSFAHSLGVIDGKAKFLGTDGWHEGVTLENGLISLSMVDVNEIEKRANGAYVLYTGSPHYVAFTKELEDIDVKETGRMIRHSAPFQKEGINVNFVEVIRPGEINIRTYERGVEDETYACGTGVVAAAIAHAFETNDSLGKCIVHARGGDLEVSFSRTGDQNFQDIKLTGPAVEVFRGIVEL